MILNDIHPDAQIGKDVKIGNFTTKLKFNMELIGGLVLIALGIKICVEGVCL